MVQKANFVGATKLGVAAISPLQRALHAKYWHSRSEAAKALANPGWQPPDSDAEGKVMFALLRGELSETTWDVDTLLKIAAERLLRGDIGPLAKHFPTRNLDDWGLESKPLLGALGLSGDSRAMPILCGAFRQSDKAHLDEMSHGDFGSIQHDHPLFEELRTAAERAIETLLSTSARLVSNDELERLRILKCRVIERVEGPETALVSATERDCVSVQQLASSELRRRKIDPT